MSTYFNQVYDDNRWWTSRYPEDHQAAYTVKNTADFLCGPGLPGTPVFLQIRPAPESCL